MFRPLAVLFLLLTLAWPANGQGILWRARSSTNSHSHVSTLIPPKDDDSKSLANDTTSGALTSDGLVGLAALAVIGATSPFWIPMILVEDNIGNPGYFPGYPYARPDAKYIESVMLFADNSERDFIDPQRLKLWATRMSIEDGHDFGSLNRMGGRFALDTSGRVGMTANWDHFTERLPGGATDETTLADLNLAFRFAQASWIEMHGGIGARGMFDRYQSRGGVNFQYGADLFLHDPIVASTLLEMGNLNEAFVMRLRASVGMQFQHAELFAGYDWLRIGSADLHGPMLGLRLWF